MMEKWKGDEEFKNQRMAEMSESFVASDADGDGRLNLEEWKVWIGGLRAKQAERGEFGDNREGNTEKWYAINNKIDPSQEGIALADFMISMGVASKHNFKVMAEKEAAAQ